MSDSAVTNATWGPAPPDFPGKGKYRTWSASWALLPDLADEPQYPGQVSIRFPAWWTPFECFQNFGRLNDPTTTKGDHG